MKKILALAIAVIMICACAFSVSAAETTVADVDSPNFWGAHSSGIEITAEGVDITFTSTSYEDAANNWEGPMYILFTDAEPKVNATVDQYKEYWVQRGDNWGWIGEVNTGDMAAVNALGITMVSTCADWDALWADYVANCKAGCEVKIHAELQDSNAVITMELQGLSMVTTVPVDTSKPVYIALSGEKVKLSNIKVTVPESKTITIEDKTFTAAAGKWLYNADVTAADAAKYSMLIFDKNYAGEVAINGYGAAIVLDQYGTLVKIYDAANMGFWTEEGKSTAPLTYTSSNYSTVAFSELQDGETLIIFPNDGGANAARAWALGLRNVGGDCYCGKAAELTGFTFGKKPTDDKTITVGDKTFTAEEGKWLYNGDVDAAAAAGYSMIIFDKNYAGEVAINGYGAAIVLDQYGTLVKIYDAANMGFWTEEGKSTAPLTYTSSNYSTVAFSELQDGETLIIFPNDGGANAARAWALGLRNVGGDCYCGQTATLTGFTFPEKPTDDKTITVGDKTFTAEEGKWLYNADVDAAAAAGYSMIIFDKNYAGTVGINGYGAAIVLDQYGKLVKIYDAANMGFWTEEGKSTAPLTYTSSNYSTVAFSELQDGETLIIFPNDGGANAARAWALGLRNVGGDCYCGQTATLTGFTFKDPSEPSGPPQTGDLIGIAVAMMAASGAALICLRKKED